jgi:hypothetical protein
MPAGPLLNISPSVIRNWKRHYEAGATAAVVANEEVVPVSQLRRAVPGTAPLPSQTR